MMLKRLLLMLKSREILAQGEDLLHQALPEVNFLLQPDIPFQAVQFFLTSSPQFMSISCSPVFTIIIFIQGFIIELCLFLKVLQFQV